MLQNILSTKIYRLIFWITLLVITFSAFSQPGPPLFPHIDKLGHFSAFLVLSLLLDLSYATIKFHSFFPNISDVKIKAGVLFCYGISIELIQSQLAWREASLLDVCANTVGIAAYFLVFKLFFPRLISTGNPVS